jgi:UDP-N-acetylmuramate dehydrogenase
MEIAENFSLKNFNTFGIDAKAKAFVEINSEDEILELLSARELKGYRKFVLGGGSNVLLTKDYDGLVIKNSIQGIEILKEDGQSAVIEAGAGENWNDLVIYCVERNFGGIENLTLIPGKVGAAPIQNIGAYGEDLSESFISLEGIDIDSASRRIFTKDECEFGYRKSVFKNALKNKIIITKVVLRLSKNPVVKTEYGNVKIELEKTGKSEFTIKDLSEVITKIRREKLPDPAVIGNAGSFFKNPSVDSKEFDLLKENYPDLKGYPADNSKIKIPAAWLIEKAGWKGKRKGNTGTHIKHSLVLVNYGNATGEEVLHFAKEIKKSIYETFGIILEEEVNII